MKNHWKRLNLDLSESVETLLNDMKMYKTLKFTGTHAMNMPILLMNSKVLLTGIKPKLISQSLTLKSAQRMAFLTHTKQMNQSRQSQ